MDFIFILLGLSTLFIFLYKREWLIEKKSYLIILWINLVLFFVGYFLEYVVNIHSKTVVALKMGLLSQLIFLALINLYRKLYGKNPVDTFWSMDSKLLKDGLFNFLFWIIGGIIPAIIVFKGII